MPRQEKKRVKQEIKEFETKCKELITLRILLGQSEDDILELLDPNGTTAPFPLAYSSFQIDTSAPPISFQSSTLPSPYNKDSAIAQLLPSHSAQQPTQNFVDDSSLSLLPLVGDAALNTTNSNSLYDHGVFRGSPLYDQNFLIAAHDQGEEGIPDNPQQTHQPLYDITGTNQAEINFFNNPYNPPFPPGMNNKNDQTELMRLG